MLNKMSTIIKKILFIPVAEKYKKEMMISIDTVNLAYGKMMAVFLILAEFLNIVVSFMIKGKNLFVQPNLNYFFMYCLLIVVMSGFWLIFGQLQKNISNHTKSILVIGILYMLFILGWCAGISLMDQQSYGQIIVYIMAIIAASVIILFQPLYLIGCYTLVQLLFIVLMPKFQPSENLLFGNSINSTLFIILALVISRIRYKNWIRDFENKKIIDEKSNDLFLINRKLENSNRKLKELAQKDGLTGLYNRSIFDKMLNIEWHRCMRHGDPLSLIMIDIDFFKNINDTYGHQIGDLCIQQVAKVLLSCVQRSSDIVTRYGGDEFAIILPQSKEESALKLGLKLKKKVAELRIFEADVGKIPAIQISVGVSTVIPTQSGSINEFIKKADDAMYQDKKT